jgi:heterodisulfide reductase subunit B
MSQAGQIEEQVPKKYAFFIGCTIQVKIPYIEKLARDIFAKLGVELADLEFSCCPTARIVKEVSIGDWLFIAARNIALAEKAGLPILSMCTGCTQTLREAQEELKDTDKLMAINEKLKSQGLEYRGTSEVKFYAQLIYELMPQIDIRKQLPISVASHPGCHILRPSRILNFDDPENPTKLDELIRLLGADAVEYNNKALCCGYGIYSVDPEAAEHMMRDKLASLQADCMAVLCPTCLEYYELRQRAIAEKMGFAPVQVVHYLQLLGLALGIDDVGFSHMKFKHQPFFDLCNRFIY